MCSDIPTSGIANPRAAKRKVARPAQAALPEHGETILFLVPITSQKPHADRVAVPMPLIEAKRADLETDKPLWIIVDEVNVDVWERSWYLEDRTPQGHFSATFVKTIQRLLQQARSAPKVVKRT